MTIALYLLIYITRSVILIILINSKTNLIKLNIEELEFDLEIFKLLDQCSTNLIGIFNLYIL